jgi:phosphatidylglycerophosphate synthase
VYLKFGISEFVPSRVSKWNTAFQLIAVFAVLVSGVSAAFEEPALVLVYAVAALTITSGLEYAYRFIYRADRLPEMARAATLARESKAETPGLGEPRSEEPS